LEIENKLEWLIRPGSQQLGAKWVEVTRAGGGSIWEYMKRIENVASNTR
jgi:hypothetical protein